MLCNLWVVIAIFIASWVLPGYGQRIKETRELPYFHSIRLLTAVNLELYYSQKPHIVIKGITFYSQRLVTQVDDQVLVISSNNSIDWEDGITVQVHAPQYQEIYLEGRGNILSKIPIQEEKLVLELAGSGKMEIELEVRELELNLTGSGKIWVHGKAKIAEIKTTGSGKVAAQELRAHRLSAYLTGSGILDLDLTPCQEAELKLTGSGNIFYRGSCPHLNISRLGSGRIQQVEYGYHRDYYRDERGEDWDDFRSPPAYGEYIQRMVERPSVELIDVQIMMTSGKLNIASSQDTTALLFAGFRSSETDWLPEIELYENKKKNTGILVLEQKRASWHYWARLEDKAYNHWDLHFHPHLKYTFDIVQRAGTSYLDFRNFSRIERLYLSTGTGDYYCNLENTSIPQLTVKAGIGTLRINLAGQWNNDLNAEIEGGVGELTLILPRNVGVRINTVGSLRKVRSAEFKKVGKYYINESYGQSSFTLYINFTGGVGILNLRSAL
ncbi:MAG: head GIN domain-containing protein [Bacteroidia bacterium]|nr:DUF2807 domain-containing protein [Bacteroidia bacterium]MDW8158756.1 head GIN domain-containing protein [Bacteroidia bacterium]